MCLLLLMYALAGCSGEEGQYSFSDTMVGSGTTEASESTGLSDGPVADSRLTGTDLATADFLEEDSDSARSAGEKESLSEEMIVVYVCGAVKQPGVYTLQPGSRINDVVGAAGGLTEDAAAAAVNLAEKLDDADMIYIPTEEEAASEDLSEGNGGSVTGGMAAVTSLVNINTADVYVLCSLPGIGESKARDIITYREKNGAFQKKEDIMKVSGIKTNLYAKICDLISVK